eukprot:CAMPEP_0117604966 /NCGR_PEP_ID=MMETSP0784-20121206/78955_1 /TAXON_ID=39447 /ORGANISM="" /LENGTH=226 /DNA_ID=CAMNT_0005408005 /DNA_START=344 /DNA_END=1021 /DNA_ORIENTATION=+
MICIQLYEHLLHNRSELILTFDLLLHSELSVILRPLHRRVDEDGGHDVEERKDRESDERKEEDRILNRQGLERIQKHTPILTARHGLVEGHGRSAHAPEMGAHRLGRLRLQRVIPHAKCDHAIREERAENQHPDQHHGPRQRLHRLAQRKNHQAELLDDADELRRPCHADDPQQTQDPQHADLSQGDPYCRRRSRGECAPMDDCLEHRGAAQKNVEQVPSPFLDEE